MRRCFFLFIDVKLVLPTNKMTISKFNQRFEPDGLHQEGAVYRKEPYRFSIATTRSVSSYSHFSSELLFLLSCILAAKLVLARSLLRCPALSFQQLAALTQRHLVIRVGMCYVLPQVIRSLIDVD